MESRTPLGELDGGRPDRRIEVVLRRPRHGRAVVELRDQHHAEGVGWYDQRVMTLDLDQLEGLGALLGRRAELLDEVRAEEASVPAILPFVPGPGGCGIAERGWGRARAASPMRRAANGE